MCPIFSSSILSTMFSVFLILVVSTPLAYTRHAPLRGLKLFPDDVVVGSHHSHQTQDVQDFEYQLSTRTNSPEVIIMEVDGNEKDFGKKHELQNEDSEEIAVNVENNIPQIQIVEDSEEDEVNSDVINGALQTESTIESKEDIKNVTTGIPPIEDDSKNEVNEQSYKVCETVKCKELAKWFLETLNKSVDPCEDFYEFSCGGWSATNSIPPYTNYWNRMNTFEYLNKRDIKDVLEMKPKRSDILPVRQAKKWYRSCTDTEKLEQRGLKPIDSIMMQVGGWPMAMDEEEWSETENSWQIVERHYARLTGSYVFYDIIAGRPWDNEFGEINITTPGLPLSSDFKFSDRHTSSDVNEEYRLLVSKIARLFIEHNRASVSDERLAKEINEMMLFEKAIDELMQADTSEYYTFFENLVIWYETNSEIGSPESGINWSSVIQGIFGLVNIEVNPSTIVFVENKAYVRGIGALLKRTPSRTIVNYIHWHFLGNVLKFTTEEMRDEFFRLGLDEETGIKERAPRWMECVNEIKMNVAASYAYVKEHFTNTTKSAVQEMTENIRIALEKKIDNSNWLDAKSKALSKEKLNNIKAFIGFPDWYYNKTAIINYYKGITISAEYFDNSLGYMRYKVKQNLKRYITQEPEDGPFNDDDATPITENAFYYRGGNYALLPAVQFASHFFGTDFPNNVNYGIAGFVVGHEMGHGFDTCGVTMGKQGEKTELTDLVLRSYYERAECFVDQFNKYYGNPKTENATVFDCDSNEENGEKTDGQITAAENIADSTGLQVVFQAYKKFSQTKNSIGEMRLPGLEEYTDDQLFFLSFAEAWCEVREPSHVSGEENVRTPFDTHSPPNLRVIGAVSNTNDFAKVFKCPSGSPMNPIDKCSIWDKPGAKVDRVSGMKSRYF